MVRLRDCAWKGLIKISGICPSGQALGWRLSREASTAGRMGVQREPGRLLPKRHMGKHEWMALHIAN